MSGSYTSKEQELHKLYFEMAGAILVVLSPEGIVDQINNIGCTILEDERSNIIGKNWFKTYLPQEAQSREWKVYRNHVSKTVQRPAVRFENYIVTSKGKERHIAWTTDVLDDDNGHVISSVIAGYDITEDQHQQNELKKFRTIIDNSSDHILVVDPETVTFVDFNETAMRELGYNRQELFQLGPAGIKVGMNKKSLKAKFDQILASPGKSGQIISKHQRKNGSILDVEINLRALQLDDKYYLLSIARNVTERKKYETIIRSMNLSVSHLTGEAYCRAVSKFLCKVFDQEKCIIAICDPEARKLNTLGYCSNQQIQKNTSLSFLENPIKETNFKMLSSERKVELINVFDKKIFKEFGPANYLIVLLKEESGRILGYLILIDENVLEPGGLYAELLQIIATRCQSEVKEILAERSLKNKNTELEFKNRIIESSLAPTITTDLEGIIRYANPAFINLWGYQNGDEINGRDIKEFFLDGERTLSKLRRVISQTHWQGELHAVSKNTTEFEVQVDATAIKDEDNKKQHIIASFVDITEGKEIERYKESLAKELKQTIAEKTEALEVNQKMYQLISENMTDLVTICEPDGTLTFVSPSVKEIIGYEVKEAIGKGIQEFIHPDDRFKICEVLTSLEEENRQIKLECRVRCASGKYLWVETTLKGIYDGYNKLAQIQTSSRDIMARKDAERVLVDALEKERHLGLLRSRFVSMASHQFRTPLTVIQSNIELLNMQTKSKLLDIEESKITKISSRIQREVSRMTDLMNDVLILGKINSDEMTHNIESVDMVELLSEFKDQTEFVQEDNRQLDVIVKGKSTPINSDRTQLGHAMMNLISNAFKYSQDSNKNPEVVLDFTHKRNLEILITDHGMGISPSEINQVFDSFYRGINAEGLPGTGLGLNIVKEYIELNKGKVSVESTINKGSTFKISLPKLQKAK